MTKLLKTLDEYINIEKLKKLDTKIAFGISQCLARGMTSINAVENNTTESEHDYNQLYNNLDNFLGPENIIILKRLIPDEYKLLQFIAIVKQLVKNQKELIHFLRITVGATVCSQIISIRNCNVPKPWRDFSIIAKSETTSFKPAKKYFPELVDFVYSELPFNDIGRIMILFNDRGQPTPMHYDHVQEDFNSEFILMMSNNTKKFFVIDDNGEKEYLEGYSGWFNNLQSRDPKLNHPVFRNHGTDIPEVPCFSIRVDGKFTDEFIEKAGISFNLD